MLYDSATSEMSPVIELIIVAVVVMKMNGGLGGQAM